MTVTTVYSGTADGIVNSSDAAYATARGGTGTLGASTAAADALFGQALDGDYYVEELFIGFDTSAIADTDTISAAVLSLFGGGSAPGTNFTAEARVYDWGGTVTTADFRTGTQYNALTIAATFATAGWSTSAYNDFTESGTNLQAAVNKTGTTYLVCSSDKLASNTAPTGFDDVQCSTADTAGTTNDPKLVVTHVAAANLRRYSLTLTGVG